MLGEVLRNWLSHAITGIAIVVVAVPEGLPLAVMLSLAYSVRKMLEDNNFVKRLSSCEIMGGANNICSDKTGTLTQNKMTWVKLWQGGIKEVKDITSLDEVNVPAKVQELMKEGAACNSLGTHLDADATELAIIKFVAKIGTDYEAMRSQLHGADLLRFPFDSGRKRMTTFLQYKDGSKTETGFNRRMHTKGAAEKILETCSHYLDAEGNKAELDDVVLSKLKADIDTLADQALRPIAFAYKDVKEGECGTDHDEIEKRAKLYNIELGGLTLFCIAGIKDIIREEVPGAVKACKAAGVRVRMVTGDNIKTAIAIAKECGIIARDGSEDKDELVCMEGPKFDEYVGSLVNRKTK
jgi:Ca2+ transporting ATPase